MLLAVTLLAVVAVSAPAQAQTPYPTTPTLTTDSPSAPAGSTVDLIGAGWPAGATVTLSYSGGTIGTVVAGADGAFSFPWNTAGVAAGTYVVTATDGTSTVNTEITLTAAADVVTPATVTPAQTAGTGTLPRTGSEASDVLRIGALLVAAGAILVLATRRRSAAEA